MEALILATLVMLSEGESKCNEWARRIKIDDKSYGESWPQPHAWGASSMVMVIARGALAPRHWPTACRALSRMGIEISERELAKFTKDLVLKRLFGPIRIDGGGRVQKTLRLVLTCVCVWQSFDALSLSL